MGLFKQDFTRDSKLQKRKYSKYDPIILRLVSVIRVLTYSLPLQLYPHCVSPNRNILYQENIYLPLPHTSRVIF